MNIERFWERVDQTAGADACWSWTGACFADGRGRVWANGRATRAYRVAYELAVGPIPAGLLVCHHCDNGNCCNPAHLFVGTHADNAADASRKGRLHGPRGLRGMKPWVPEWSSDAARDAFLATLP